MFEAAEVGARVDPEEYDRLVPGLRVDLLNAQFELQSAAFPVIVLLMGDDRSGVSDVVNLLHEWMDARHIETHMLRAPTQEESERPALWRFWRTLPAHGKLGLYLGGWVLPPLAAQLEGEGDAAAYDRELARVQRFEQTLTADGGVVLKLWLHRPKAEAKTRLRRARKDPESAWRVDALDRALYKSYDALVPLAETLIHRTSTHEAPWQIVESTDWRHRNWTVGRTLLAAIRERLQAARTGASGPAVEPAAASTVAGSTAIGTATGSILDGVDLSKRLERDEYVEKLRDAQRELRKRVARARDRGITSVVVLEGWDAAGKGGVIRRITRALDAWDYEVLPTRTPTDEERAHHPLWRFWRHLPRAGRLWIVDGSWYGRVLGDMVEGRVPREESARAYAEINDFEQQLVDHGIPVSKFWLHLDPDEQRRRLQAREQSPYEKYRITEDDYRAQYHRDAYIAAVDEMVARTSTGEAPWHLVAANDKPWARVEVLRHICAGLKAAVKNAQRGGERRRA